MTDPCQICGGPVRIEVHTLTTFGGDSITKETRLLEPNLRDQRAADDLRHTPPVSLTVRDTTMLDFERSWWKHAGAKDEEIREQFEMTSVRYYAALNALIDQPEALAHDPMVVRRLRRRRERRPVARVGSQ